MKVFDFRLQVFLEVAENLSFTKAASRLSITQPAVTRHVREMEQQLNVRLFDRQGNHISLTEAGAMVLRYAEKVRNAYGALEAELSQLEDVTKGFIRIGASTTVAQTVVPKLLALFKSAYPDIIVQFTQGNSDFITQQVLSEALDLAIIEGGPYHTQISYTPFMKDEVVLVVRAGSKLAEKGTIQAAELYQVSLVLREAGSGTLDIIFKALAAAGIDPDLLQIDIRLESTIAIKEYLQYADAAAFLSIQSVVNELKHQQLAVVDVEGIGICRDFRFIQLQGNNTRLIELVKRFYTTHYNHR